MDTDSIEAQQRIGIELARICQTIEERTGIPATEVLALLTHAEVIDHHHQDDTGREHSQPLTRSEDREGEET